MSQFRQEQRKNTLIHNKSRLLFFVTVNLIMLALTQTTNAALTTEKVIRQVENAGILLMQTVPFDADDQKVMVYRKGITDHLILYQQSKSENIILNYQQAGLSDGFIRLKWIQIKQQWLLATIWQRGVHGEQLHLFDPHNGKQLYQLSSGWPIQLGVCNDNLIIRTHQQDSFQSDQPESSYYNDIYIWHQPDWIEIRMGSEPVCRIPQQLPPVDNHSSSVLPHSLQKFIQRLESAITERNFTLVLSLLAEDIENGLDGGQFDGSGGITEFRELWQPQTTTLFHQLRSIMSGGGVLTRDQENNYLYCMPRLSVDFPPQLNVFNHVVLTAENVPVYLRPDSRAPILTHLSYSILAIDSLQDHSAWQKVILNAGVQGFVQRSKVRSPIDYQLCLYQPKDKNWRISSLKAGD